MYSHATYRSNTPLFNVELTRSCALKDFGCLRCTRTRQSGAVLMISMIILLIMTLIGVTAMNSATLEEKMAGNSTDTSLAFQAAEAALRESEAWVSTQPTEPGTVSTCSSAPCNVWQFNASAVTQLTTKTQAWWVVNGRPYGDPNAVDLAPVKTDPRYIVEYLDYRPDNKDIGYGAPSGGTVYRVTASGTGGADTTQVILQSTYLKRFN